MMPLMLSNNGCNFPWQVGKVKKIEVQSISINLKVIQKEKIEQTTLLGLL